MRIKRDSEGYLLWEFICFYRRACLNKDWKKNLWNRLLWNATWNIKYYEKQSNGHIRLNLGFHKPDRGKEEHTA